MSSIIKEMMVIICRLLMAMLAREIAADILSMKPVSLNNADFKLSIDVIMFAAASH